MGYVGYREKKNGGGGGLESNVGERGRVRSGRGYAITVDRQLFMEGCVARDTKY